MWETRIFAVEALNYRGSETRIMANATVSEAARRLKSILADALKSSLPKVRKRPSVSFFLCQTAESHYSAQGRDRGNQQQNYGLVVHNDPFLRSAFSNTDASQ
jgi:hypothetical protein